jgi:hypothetical protein
LESVICPLNPKLVMVNVACPVAMLPWLGAIIFNDAGLMDIVKD